MMDTLGPRIFYIGCPLYEHIRDEHFVHCSEVVPSSEVEMNKYRQGQTVCCREGVHPGPLYERVSGYIADSWVV